MTMTMHRFNSTCLKARALGEIFQGDRILTKPIPRDNSLRFGGQLYHHTLRSTCHRTRVFAFLESNIHTHKFPPFLKWRMYRHTAAEGLKMPKTHKLSQMNKGLTSLRNPNRAAGIFTRTINPLALPSKIEKDFFSGG